MQAIFMSGYRPSQWVPQVQRKLNEATAAQEKEAKDLAAKIDAVVLPLKKRQTEMQTAAIRERFQKTAKEDVLAALTTDLANRTDAQKVLVKKFEADLKTSTPMLIKQLDQDPLYKKQIQQIADEIKTHESNKRTFAEIRAFYDLP